MFEINSLIYTLQFFVIDNSNRHFFKCQSNTQLFQKTFFNSFYQTLCFLKKFSFILYFLKPPLFQKILYKKAEPNSPLVDMFTKPSLPSCLRDLVSKVKLVTHKESMYNCQSFHSPNKIIVHAAKHRSLHTDLS